jgi:NADP-dependent 3-hydroxy acid dehydrogenase YdfG
MGQACARRLVGTVGTLPLVDRDEATVTAAAKELAAAGGDAAVEPFVLDITDRDGLPASPRAPPNSAHCAPSPTPPASRP